MTESSLQHEALATLDRALRETDPLTRMMLIERTLRLHRRAIEAGEDGSASEPLRADEEARHRRH